MLPSVQQVVPKPGLVISDRYRLEENIGHGGYSLVFRANELRLNREVALKLLSKDTVDAAGLERFRREADLARQLQHPNTVRLLDFDLEAEPMPFIVYELLHGMNLAQLLKREGALPEERVVRLTTQILKSLMESHAVGIVHRDVKPGNVFVCTYAGEPDFVKVLDFGIAKTVGPDSLQLTANGMLVGTPRYMPPDQIRGLPPKPGMDLFAVGMMMAEMLAGTPVIRGSAADACLIQLSNDPVPLPPAALASRLASVIQRAVDKDPERRYPLANTMLEDLSRALLAAPVQQQWVGAGAGDSALDEAPTTLMAGESVDVPTVDAPLAAPEPLARPLAPAPPRSNALVVVAVVVVTLALGLVGLVILWLVRTR